MVGFMASIAEQPSSSSPQSHTSLNIRDDSTDCPQPSYVTVNGLEFDTSCGVDILYPEVGNQVQPSMPWCMDLCSWYQPVCYGVTYYTQNQTCSLKGLGVNSTFFSTTDSDNVNVNSALANVTQMAPLDTSCPYQNNSIIESSRGMPFHILCDQDMGGYGDYFPWGVTNRPHTDTMMECMELCAQAHPLCVGVSWNADLTAGYGNCYLKNSQNGVPFTPSSYVTHSGLVQMPVTNSCSTSDPKQLTSNGKTFNVTCFEARAGSNNFTSVYSANITGCVDECAAYDGPESCLAVFYDNTCADGFDNCYLLNATGTQTVPRNCTYAELASGNPSGSSPSPSPSTSAVPSTSTEPSPGASSSDSSSGGSSSKAWIAGPVVGVVAAVAIAFAGFLWWRRRQQPYEEENKFVPVNQGKQMGSPDLHELPRYPVSEMAASEPRHELPTD
ncbi:hypothetical protein PISL3812_08656 [Talaromyces islandicus]|uniref:Apple domain-containing protein n=1 Tax=Talaromyces islandicus TaxID=28573 RepID=A0A0U1M9L2_TALIS|nr:hypothetical protein PISL3812_08656 [Talaromyces islandicus]